jgi:hypothetical protein
MTTTDKPEIMTTKDVFTEFLIPEGTQRYYRSAGIGPPSFRLAGRVRYRHADVLARVAAQEQATRRGGVV